MEDEEFNLLDKLEECERALLKESQITINVKIGGIMIRAARTVRNVIEYIDENLATIYKLELKDGI